MSGLKRVYVGKLPQDVRQDDIEALFRDFKIRECRLMAGFGFIEFEDARDAEDAVTKFDGAKLLGEPIMVEFAKERRPREGMDPRGGGGGFGGPPGGAGGFGGPRRAGVKVLLKGVGSDVSWQDLKDFGREAGRPLRADVDRASGDGFLEFGSQEEAQQAVEKLSTMEIRGRRPECTIDTSAPQESSYGGGGGRGYGGGDRGYDRERSYRDDRGGYPPREDRGGYPPREERGGYPPREDRGGYPSREDRGGYPPRDGGDRGGYSSRREYEPRDRSPPRRDDYRSGGGGGRHDDRRERGGDPYERRERRVEEPRAGGPDAGPLP